MNQRLKKLFRSFEARGIDALLVSSWPNVTYLSGFKGTESWILVSPKALYFITDSRYSEEAEKEAKGFEVILRDSQPVLQLIADLANKIRARRLGFESSVVTHAFFSGLERRLGPDRLKATDGLVEELRLIKDAGEIASLRKSADIAV